MRHGKPLVTMIAGAAICSAVCGCERKKKAESEPPPQRPAQVEPRTGGFFLETEPPEASVWVDDRPVEGKTPVTVTGLEPGKHLLRIVKGELYDQVNLEVEVQPGKITRLPLKMLELREVDVEFREARRSPRFDRGMGAPSVQTRPWSKVYIDGKFVKNTPLVN